MWVWPRVPCRKKCHWRVALVSAVALVFGNYWKRLIMWLVDYYSLDSCGWWVVSARWWLFAHWKRATIESTTLGMPGHETFPYHPNDSNQCRLPIPNRQCRSNLQDHLSNCHLCNRETRSIVVRQTNHKTGQRYWTSHTFFQTYSP